MTASLDFHDGESSLSATASGTAAPTATRARPPAARPRPGCGRWSCRWPPRGGCAPCPRTGAGDRRDRRDRRPVGGGAQHVPLALGERAGSRRERLGGQDGIDHPQARVHPPHGVDELLGRRVLHHEAGRPGPHRPRQVTRAPERREDDDPAGRQRRVQLGGGVEAVPAGHLDVQQRHVDVVRGRRGHHFRARSDLGHDLDVGLQPQHRRQRPPYQRLVVGQQHPDHACPQPSRRWTAALTRGPPSARAGTPPAGGSHRTGSGLRRPSRRSPRAAR